jgi:SPP1 gp7 family putative phage head morphogenesis protein
MALIKTNRDIRVESLYKRIDEFAKKASRDVTVDILKALKNKDDILPALYGLLDVLEVHIIDAMVAAHLMGYLRSLIISANHMSEQKLFGQYDDAINFAKRRLEVPKSQITVEKKVQSAMKTIIERNYHIKNAMMHMNSTLKKAGINSANPWLVETVVRTQIHTAYSAGRWDGNQDPAIQSILWGYQYVTAGDFRVRDEHEMLDGVRLPKEDPQWNSIWPPNGFNCRCEVIEIFKDDKKRAVRKEIPAAKTVGNRLVIPGADEGWAVNHGEVFISGISRGPVAQDIVQEFMTIVDKFGRQIHVPLRSKYATVNTEQNKLKWIKSFEKHKDDKLKWMRAVDDLIAKGEKVNFETSFWHPRAIHYYNWQSKRVSTIKRVAEIIPPKPVPKPLPVPGPPPPGATRFETAEEYRQFIIKTVEANKGKYKSTSEWIRLESKNKELKKQVVKLRDEYTSLYDKRKIPSIAKKRDLIDDQMRQVWRKQDQILGAMKRIRKAEELGKRDIRKLLAESKSMKGKISGREYKKYQKTMDEILDWIPEEKLSVHEIDNIKYLNLNTNPWEGYASDSAGEYYRQTHTIAMYQNSQQVFAHEFGHHLTYKTKGFMGKQTAFHRMRTAGEKSGRLPRYRDLIGKKDKYNTYDVYAGRRYTDGSFPEVASVGIEHVWKNPYTAAKKDPEWFNMIISAIKKIP